MKRWPSLSLFTVVLFVIWLLLNDSLAPGQIRKSREQAQVSQAVFACACRSFPLIS